MLGYLKSYIVQAQNLCIHQAADVLMEFGMVDLLRHFQQRWQFHHMNTWPQVQRGILLQTRCH